MQAPRGALELSSIPPQLPIRQGSSDASGDVGSGPILSSFVRWKIQQACGVESVGPEHMAHSSLAQHGQVEISAGGQIKVPTPCGCFLGWLGVLLIGRPEDAPLALERSIELCQVLKATSAAKPALDVSAVHP